MVSIKEEVKHKVNIVPRQGREDFRGSSLGAHGTFHNPWLHNQIVHDIPDAKKVTPFEAQEHKQFMNGILL